VVILSGAPGVGKTTIARLLVAQATADGFEPIEISADVDEGQRVLRRTERQIFYYDDFLGSTFLTTRLDKNEDRRIAQFIRACEQGENTRFIMTTREYILRQAIDEYQELELAGLDLRKLVIAVDHYSRVERAHIFYNHVYHSPYVSAEALDQLRDGNSYLKIIDHRNYNPRLIEFITTSDPSLRASPPDNFVAYALSNLDNPQSVWRRPFDIQLDQTGRSLVVALASMPRRIFRADAERLLESCAQSGKCSESRPGMFEMTLGVLDDTFLSTLRVGEDRREIVLGLANPSIADFVAGHLAGLRSQWRSAVASIVFFEQIDWYISKVRSLMSHVDDFDAALVEAVRRCIFSASADIRIQPSGSGRPPEPVRAEVSVTERLISVCIFMERSRIAEDALKADLVEWLEWDHGEWMLLADVEQCRTFVDLVERVDELGCLTDEVWQSALSAVDALAPSWERWQLTQRLGSIRGLDRSFFESYRSEFEAWFNGLLDYSPSYVGPSSDLDEARSWAEHLGVSFDQEQFDSLMDEILRREDVLADQAISERKDRVFFAEDDSGVRALFER